jgi:hypothetical protein
MIVQYLSPSCTYSAGTHTVTCHTTTLKAGTNVTYTIQVQVKGTQKFTLINTAPVTSDTDDPDTSNNSDTVTNVVQGSTGKGKKP